MTPLELAARALCLAHGTDPDLNDDGIIFWTNYIPAVKTVLRAIRTPSAEMADAGEAALAKWNQEHPAFVGSWPIWQAMVDECSHAR